MRGAPPYRWLTGRSRHRVNTKGELVLQVEEETVGTAATWRDAKVEDLTVNNSLPEVVT